MVAQGPAGKGLPPDAGREGRRRLPRGYWPETERVALLFHRGHRELLWDLVGRLEPVVHRVARGVRNERGAHWLEDEDLLQIGRLGAAEILEGYDPAGRAKIDSYVGHWLPHRVLRSVGACAPIRTPPGVVGEDLGRRAELLLEAAYESTPDVPEGTFVAEETGFEEVMIADAYARFATGAPLPEPDAHVLKCRFGLDGARERTLAEVAEEFGRSREWVRQRQEKALAAIREHVRLSYGIAVKPTRGADTTQPRGPSPAVTGGYFSLGELSAEPERSISSPGEWGGTFLPFKKNPPGTPRRESPGGGTRAGENSVSPAPRRRPPSGTPAELARRGIEEYGVVRAADILGRRRGDREKAAVVGRLRGMGLVEVATGYWARPLSPAVGRAARRTLENFGPMPVDGLLARLRFNPAVRADDLPVAAVLRSLLDGHPAFRVDTRGLVHPAPLGNER